MHCRLHAVSVGTTTWMDVQFLDGSLF